MTLFNRSIRQIQTTTTNTPNSKHRQQRTEGNASFNSGKNHKEWRVRSVCIIFCLSLAYLLAQDNVSVPPSNYRIDEELSIPQLKRREVFVHCRNEHVSLHSTLRGNRLVIKPKKSWIQPRITCLAHNLHNSCDVEIIDLTNNRISDCFPTDSIPTLSDLNSNGSDTKKELSPPPGYNAEEECTLSDPSYENLSDMAPPSCNDVHSMGLTSSSLNDLSEVSVQREQSLNYLSEGGYNSVWKYDSLRDKLIMKMHRLSRKFTKMEVDRNRRDAFVSGRTGKVSTQYNNNVLPIHQYCGYTLVVPLARIPLDKYVENYRKIHDGQFMGAIEMFRLAFQAARGLYQSHAYLDEKATIVHSDIKPSQFLLFEPPESKSNLHEQRIPLLQLNDFNRCRFLYRSQSNETCPFRICGIKHKGSTYRSPEEYMECADQKDSIDVFSLGGVFYYLLSDGLHPYNEADTFEKAIKKILKGKLPRLPPIELYEQYGSNTVKFIEQRNKHPAFIALESIMLNCLKFNPDIRPTSYEILKTFETKARDVMP